MIAAKELNERRRSSLFLVLLALHSVQITHFVEDCYGHKKAQKTQEKATFLFCAFCASSWLFLFGCGVSRAVFSRGNRYRV